MRISNKSQLEEIVSGLDKGHMVSLTLNYSSWVGNYRVGRYMGRTKNRMWIMSCIIGTPWFEVKYPMGYRFGKIADIELFDD